jgi:hypothetical protein
MTTALTPLAFLRYVGTKSPMYGKGYYLTSCKRFILCKHLIYKGSHACGISVAWRVGINPGLESRYKEWQFWHNQTHLFKNQFKTRREALAALEQQLEISSLPAAVAPDKV